MQIVQHAPAASQETSVPNAPSRTFSMFVTDAETALSLATVRSFAEGEDSGQGSRLLFIHAGDGCGKTHLLEAVSEAYGKRRLQPAFLPAHELMHYALDHANGKGTSAAIERLHSWSALVIDDFHVVCEQHAEVVRHALMLIRAYTERRRPVVLASGRALHDLGLSSADEAFLRSGHEAAFRRPGRELREAILTRCLSEDRRPGRYALSSEELGRLISPEVITRLAETEATPRQLLAVLRKLIGYAEIAKKPIEMAQVEGLLSLGPCSAHVLLERILHQTASFYKLSHADILSTNRARRVARPRQVAMALARRYTNRSLPEIGRFFGGKDHTTVLHAMNRVEELCETDPYFHGQVACLSSMIGKQVAA